MSFLFCANCIAAPEKDPWSRPAKSVGTVKEATDSVNSIAMVLYSMYSREGRENRSIFL